MVETRRECSSLVLQSCFLSELPLFPSPLQIFYLSIHHPLIFTVILSHTLIDLLESSKLFKHTHTHTHGAQGKSLARSRMKRKVLLVIYVFDFPHYIRAYTFQMRVLNPTGQKVTVGVDVCNLNIPKVKKECKGATVFDHDQTANN